MRTQQEQSPATWTGQTAVPHIVRVFDTGEAILLRAKQISQQLEDRVRRLLQDEQRLPRDIRR